MKKRLLRCAVGICAVLYLPLGCTGLNESLTGATGAERDASFEEPAPESESDSEATQEEEPFFYFSYQQFQI